MKKLTDSKKILTFITALFAIILISSSCNKSTYGDMTGTGGSGGTGGAGGPGANEVFIQGMAFSPSSITVSAGTTVTWTNKDAIAHTVTSLTNLFNSGNLNSGGTFSYTFATAGSYSYYCSIHPTMTATVTVQ
jgi:plastocyanin